MAHHTNKSGPVTISGKKLYVIGFGSNYFHQFTDVAVPLDLFCNLFENDGKGADLSNQQSDKSMWRPLKNADDDDKNTQDIPNVFHFPLQLQDDIIESDDSSDNANRAEKGEKISASQKIRNIMRWRRKVRKQEQIDGNVNNDIINSNSGRPNISIDKPTDKTNNVRDIGNILAPVITDMCAGLTFNALIANGNLYVMGTIHGQIFPEPTIQRPISTSIKCLQISCGKRHILALFENKTTMSMGSGYFGQLGHGFDCVHCEKLTIIDRLSSRFIEGEVVRVEAGGMHSAAIITKDPTSWEFRNERKDIETTVYQWGSNKFGQCAIDEGACNAIPYPTSMSEVRDPETGKRVAFVALSLSKLHTVGLSHHCQVYSWGITGRCGHGDTHRGGRKSALKMKSSAGITLPKRVEALKNIKIVQISSGDAHSLALSESGRVFSWGNNSYGQLGFGHSMHILSPRCIIDLQFGLRTRDINVAKEALTKAAENNQTKQTYPIIHKHEATSDTSPHFDLAATVGHIHYPSTPLKNSSKKRYETNDNQQPPFISSIHAAGSYSAAVSSSGDLYSWGCAENEQLGHGISGVFPNIEPGPLPQTGASLRIRESKSFDSRLNIFLPRRVEMLRTLGLKTLTLSSSPNFMVVLCERDQHYNEKTYCMGKTLYELEVEKRNRGVSQIHDIRSPNAS